MKRFLSLAALAATTVLAQTAVPTYTFSDISLYGSKNPERFAFFAGEAQTVALNNGRVELSKPIALPLSGFTVPRTLFANGSSNLKLDIKPLDAFSGSMIGDQVQVRAKRNVQSVYYFDGAKWFTVARSIKAGEAAQLKPTPRASPFGAGLLSSDEAVALSKYLTPKGELLLATLSETDAPDSRVLLNPAPSTYRRSVLAIQYGLPKTAPSANTVPVPSNVTTEPLQPTTVQPMPTNPNPPAASVVTIPVIKTIEASSNAAYSQGESLTRFDDNQAEWLETWKLISGNQVPLPPAPIVDFGKKRMVTVFLGQRPTGGFGVSYKSATLEDNTLKLVIETTSPAPGRLVTQVITSPFVVLEVSNTNFNVVQVEFIEK
jgi:PrcB C-terminal